MAALTLTLGAVDRTSRSKFESIEVVNTIAANSDHARVVISTTAGSTWRPKAGNQIVIADASTQFGGYVMRVSEANVGNNRLNYTLDCRDYTHLFDRLLVVAEYAATAKASTIVSDVISSFTTGFTATNVQSSPYVPAQKFDYESPTDVLRKLSDSITWGWYIDYAKDVHFFSLTSYVAPVSAINLDTNTTDYGDMVIEESVEQVKNFIYVKGWKQRSTVQYLTTKPGDGITSFFGTDWEPASNSTSDLLVTVNGVKQSIGIDVVDNAPGSTVAGSYDAYLCFDNLGLRFNTAPPAGQNVAMTENYMTPGFTAVQDIPSQIEMASREGGDGIHEFVIDDPNLTASDGSASLAEAKGNAVLARDSMPRITGGFGSFTQGWRAGQGFSLSSTQRWGTQLSETVYVQEVVKHLVNHPVGGSPVWHYDIKFSDNALAV